MTQENNSQQKIMPQHVDKLFDLFSDLYGTKFITQYKNFERAKKNWLTMLDSQDLESLRKAVKFLSPAKA